MTLYNGPLTLDGEGPVDGSVWLQLSHDVDVRWSAEDSVLELGDVELGRWVPRMRLWP